MDLFLYEIFFLKKKNFLPPFSSIMFEALMAGSRVLGISPHRPQPGPWTSTSALKLWALDASVDSLSQYPVLVEEEALLWLS